MNEAPRSISLSNITPMFVSVGCPVIDNLLRGGLQCGSITEIAGWLRSLSQIKSWSLHLIQREQLDTQEIEWHYCLLLAGEFGSGKTQICLQCCLSVQWQKEHGGLQGSAM